MRRARCRAPFRGTYRYASLDAMKYREQAPKDDVESWLYLLVEWTSGKLPWRRLEMVNLKTLFSKMDYKSRWIARRKVDDVSQRKFQ